MNCYWFNRQEILRKAKGICSKEKAAEYYAQNNKAINENSRRTKGQLITRTKGQD